MKNRHLVVIAGPTAIGKTSLGIALAKKFQTEILSADSRQLYREMSIGTAKPTLEEMEGIPHHFINHCSIQETEPYSASKFEKEGLALLDKLFEKHQIVFLVGGSGLYINALCHGFDDELPTADPAIRSELTADFEQHGITVLQERLKTLDPSFYKEIDQQNPKRLMRAIEVCILADKPFSELRKGKRNKRPFSILKIGLELPREVLYDRINQRVDQMIEHGLEEEVVSLLPYQHSNALNTVGYQELFQLHAGDMTRQEAIEKIKVNSRRYAKRQLTWFKKDNEFQWFNPLHIKEIFNYIHDQLKNKD